jgi:hypothetical protein
MNIHTYLRSVALALVLTIAGCADYEFTVNNKTVYTPLPLYSDYQIGDSALQACVNQTIEDQKITQAQNLQALSCSHAGIAELAGLEAFSELQSLHLQHNNISSTRILAQLTQLQQLDISHNGLTNGAGLLSLKQLQRVDLSDNPKLNCASIDTGKLRRGLQLILPQHCRQ